MSIFKHTPGPWKDGIGPDCKPVVFQTSIQARAFDGAYNEEHRANCLLLDAAPELLAALRVLCWNYRTSTINDINVAAAEEIIKRATTL